MITIDNVSMSEAAAENVHETGISVEDDLHRLRIGEQTPEGLLVHCLDGADPDREQGWHEYVAALKAAL